MAAQWYSKHQKKDEHEGEKIDIQSYLQKQPELGSYELTIPQKGMVDSKVSARIAQPERLLFNYKVVLSP